MVRELGQVALADLVQQAHKRLSVKRVLKQAQFVEDASKLYAWIREQGANIKPRFRGCTIRWPYHASG